MKRNNNFLKIYLITLGFLIIISSIGTGESKTLYVGFSGNVDYISIQEAINSSESGDTIMINNGTYMENIFINKSINLIGNNSQESILVGNIIKHTFKLKSNYRIVRAIIEGHVIDPIGE